MERISGDGFFSYRREVDLKRDARRSKRTGSSRSFSSELRETESREFDAVAAEVAEAETAELLDAVFAVGDKLKRQRDTATLMSYKNAVKKFLTAIVRRGLDIDERQSGSSIMRRKRYTILQIVDAKLEQLAAGMISSQRDQLDLLARVDEINGLLVDLQH
ncbi:MAG: YaaR family protein [Spirochaetota bacterium]